MKGSLPHSSATIHTSDSEGSNATPNAIRYPVVLTHDTIANRLAALQQFAQDLPSDQHPVLIQFIEKPL